MNNHTYARIVRELKRAQQRIEADPLDLEMLEHIFAEWHATYQAQQGTIAIQKQQIAELRACLAKVVPGYDPS
jgi:hypothetical protein